MFLSQRFKRSSKANNDGLHPSRPIGGTIAKDSILNLHFSPAYAVGQHPGQDSEQERKFHIHRFRLRQFNSRQNNRLLLVAISCFFLLLCGAIYVRTHPHEEKEVYQCGCEEEECGLGIPRRLIFTYENNMLETKAPKHLYDNVQNTIQMYSKLWNQNATDVEVLFFDDQRCYDVINRIDPRLIDPFLYEPYGAYAADICRAAALYCHGGYYFDVDLQSLKTLEPQPHINFITAMDWLGTGYFQAILAASPWHPVMKYTFDSMINDWYYNPKIVEKYRDKYGNDKFRPNLLYNRNSMNIIEKSVGHGLMGPGTLRKGFKKFEAEATTNTTWILKEMNNWNKDEDRAWKYDGLLRHRSNSHDAAMCNFIVEDPDTDTPYFHSRIEGTQLCPKEDRTQVHVTLNLSR